MIRLHDTTLRDGDLREGTGLTDGDRLRIVSRLDAMGIHYIEAAFPSFDSRSEGFMEKTRAIPFEVATVCACGTIAGRDDDFDEDANLSRLAGCAASVISLIGESCDRRVGEISGIDPDENLARIAGSIQELVAAGKRVFYNAGNYFEGYEADPGYALATLIVAHDAGAETVVLCDTAGGFLPHDIYAITKTTVDTLQQGGYDLIVGIHAANDCGCAVANTLEAVRAGARHVQGVIEGVEQRAGGADLATVLVNLQSKMGYNLVDGERLALAKMTPAVDSTPYVELDGETNYFTLESFRVIVEKRDDGRTVSEATIKLVVGNRRYIATGEGSGPVNALDVALRLAIGQFYPQVSRFEITDYRVTVPDGSLGSGAVVRVELETGDGKSSWGTVGVSKNVMEASWDALVKAITYGLLHSEMTEDIDGKQT